MKKINKPMVSVIIPVYNTEKYIRQCLNSIICQTYTNLDIIIVIDGSPDNCGKICDGYAARDSRIRVIHKSNAGVSEARNDGINAAKGEWISFVDSDDWLELDYYKTLIESVEGKEADIFFSGGAIRSFPQNEIECHSIRKSFLLKKGENDEWDRFLIKTLFAYVDDDILNGRYAFAVCWNVLYHKNFLLENGLWFDRSLPLLEDVLFNFMALDQAKTVAGCTYIGYHYRKENDLSASGRVNNQYLEKMYLFYDKFISYKPLEKQSETVKQGIHALTLHLFRKSLYHCFFQNERRNNGSHNDDLRKEKKRFLVQQAVYGGNNPYLYKREKILKLILHFPGILPLKVFYEMDRRYPSGNR